MNFFSEFENTNIKNNNFFLELNNENTSNQDSIQDENIFNIKNIEQKPIENVQNPIRLTKINDYDLNLINDSLANHLPTESLKIEFLLQKAEKELNQLDNEIQNIKILNLPVSKDKLIALETRKIIVIEKINSLKKQYKNLDKFNSISEIFSDMYNLAQEKTNSAKNLVTHNQFTRTLKKSIPAIQKNEELKEINKKFLFLTGSINQISDKKTSFGSLTTQRNLAIYLNEANKLNKQYNRIITPNIQNFKKTDNKLILFLNELKELVNRTLQL